MMVRAVGSHLAQGFERMAAAETWCCSFTGLPQKSSQENNCRLLRKAASWRPFLLQPIRNGSWLSWRTAHDVVGCLLITEIIKITKFWG